MQMVKKSALIVVALWLGIVVLMPKSELYYTLEEKLNAQEITLNEESIDEGLFSLTLHKVTVFVKGIPLATIDEVNFCTLLFYSTVEIDTLALDEVLHTKAPALTTKAELTHTLFSPMSLSVDANGTFGVIEGDIDLMNKSVYVDFVEESDISMIQAHLKKGEKGWYYENSF